MVKINKTYLGYTIEIYIDNIDEILIKEVQNIIKNIEDKDRLLNEKYKCD